jgi:hypothetical protein
MSVWAEAIPGRIPIAKNAPRSRPTTPLNVTVILIGDSSLGNLSFP